MGEPSANSDSGEQTRVLGTWDTISIVVGIVIGVGIHETAPIIFGITSNPWQALGCWIAGGVLSLFGVLCYAELATTYPRMGGAYHYLSRAYGPWAGFLFGWANLTLIKPANIGMMAFIFGDYARLLFGAALFGMGWGLAGYCPGPAITSSTLGGWPTWAFLIAMLAGMFIAQRLPARSPMEAASTR